MCSIYGAVAYEFIVQLAREGLTVAVSRRAMTTETLYAGRDVESIVHKHGILCSF